MQQNSQTHKKQNKQNKQSKRRGLGRTQGTRGGTARGFRRGGGGRLPGQDGEGAERAEKG